MREEAFGIVVVLGVLLLWFAFWLFDSCEGEAAACDGTCMVEAAILKLQPRAGEERAAMLAREFVAAGHEASIDPLLLVAIAMRESSLARSVESLEKLGALGERGLLQLHPGNAVALRLRPAKCSPQLEGAMCQIRTGTRFLAFVRDYCGGSTWRWLAAYGMGRCPSEDEAWQDRTTRIAVGYYRRIGGVID